MRLVIVESPFRAAGLVTRTRNTHYLHALMRFCFARGDAPFASHELYTRCLDDDVPAEREAGIEAGLAWGECAALTVVGIDRGLSEGMVRGIQRARVADRPIEFASLQAWRETGPTELLSAFDGVRIRGVDGVTICCRSEP